MQLLDHVSVTVRDLAHLKPFCTAIFDVRGAPLVYETADALGFGQRNRTQADGHTSLRVLQSPDAAPDARRHLCFRAGSHATVEAFHVAGLATGGEDAGRPGLRHEYHSAYYAAFLFDPEGNKLEAVYHREE